MRTLLYRFFPTGLKINLPTPDPGNQSLNSQQDL